jgi:hypothetical protein
MFVVTSVVSMKILRASVRRPKGLKYGEAARLGPNRGLLQQLSQSVYGVNTP